MSLAERTRIAVAILAVSALALAGCQTTGDAQPPGAVVGGVTGAAAGLGAQAGIKTASGGHAGNPLLGLVVGAVAGALAGQYATSSDDGPRFAVEAAAAREVAEDPTSQRVEWESDEKPTVHGWAEAVTKTPTAYGCKLIRSVIHEDGKEHRRIRQFCQRGDRWIEH